MSAVHSLSQNMFHAVVLTSIWYYQNVTGKIWHDHVYSNGIVQAALY
jgi:hypothetical protein